MTEVSIAYTLIQSGRLREAVTRSTTALDDVARQGACSPEQALRVARLLEESSEVLREGAELVQKALDWTAEPA